MSQQSLIGSSSNLELMLWEPNTNTRCECLATKIISNRRRPQDIKSGISQHTLIWSSSTFKLKPNQTKIKYCCKRRLPQIEDDLKISKVEPIKLENSLQWRRLPIKDDLNISRMDYLSNHLSDLPQFLNLI